MTAQNVNITPVGGASTQNFSYDCLFSLLYLRMHLTTVNMLTTLLHRILVNIVKKLATSRDNEYFKVDIYSPYLNVQKINKRNIFNTF